jgi:hypothetical protein
MKTRSLITEISIFYDKQLHDANFINRDIHSFQITFGSKIYTLQTFSL